MAANGLLGRLPEYDLDSDFGEYVERLDQFFLANDIVDPDRQRAVFLTCMGPRAYALLRKLAAPRVLATIGIDELCELLRAHQHPRPSQIVQRFRLNSRVRKQGESVAEYVAELRNLSEYCDYGDHVFPMLRDRLVCGVNHPSIQKRLLGMAGDDLTFDRAVEIAIGMETAEWDVQDITGGGGRGAGGP